MPLEVYNRIMRQYELPSLNSEDISSVQYPDVFGMRTTLLYLWFELYKYNHSHIFYLLPWRNNKPTEVHCRPLLVNTMETNHLSHHLLFFASSLSRSGFVEPSARSLLKMIFFCSSVTQFLCAIFSGSLNATLTAQRHDRADDITATATCSVGRYRCKRQRKEELLWPWILIWRLVMGLSVT